MENRGTLSSTGHGFYFLKSSFCNNISNSAESPFSFSFVGIIHLLMKINRIRATGGLAQ